MTKPHEEEWMTGAGALSGALYAGATWIGSFTRPERARLAVQAPMLVRSLLATRRVDRTEHCWCHHARDIRVAGHSEACGEALTALRGCGVIT